jgi:hypothetical protein
MRALYFPIRSYLPVMRTITSLRASCLDCVDVCVPPGSHTQSFVR